jgi:4-amino-4-deoxy-L-arabinose transferase-like glycosyltransferase
MTAADQSRGVRTWPLWLCLGLLWFATMPWRALLEPDEGRYAEIPREMVVSGDWVTPRLNDLKYFEKPVLQYWATAVVYTAFGRSQWTSRLWAAALAFLCIPMVYGFARRSGWSRDVALTAAMLLAINPYFAITGHVNLLDQAFAFFLVAAIFSFVLAQREKAGDPRERNWMLLTWAALALAVLSKGIAALVLAGATLAIHMLWARDPSVLRRLHLLTGLPLFAVIAVPWFWVVQARNPEFAGFFFVHEHFARFLTTVHHRTEPWWFFAAILLVALTPVLWSTRSAIVLARRQRPAAGEFPVARLLAIWCAVVLAFFSISQSKLAPYIMPMMPPLAVLMAPAVHEHRGAQGRAWFALGALSLLVGIALVVLCRQRSGAIDAALGTWVAIAVVTALLPAPAILRRTGSGSPAAGWVALGAATIFTYQALMMAYAELPPELSTRTLAMQVKPHIDKQTQLYSIGQFRRSLPFYLDRTLQLVDYSGETDFGVAQAGGEAMLDTRRFRERWDPSPDAIAFIEPKRYRQLADDGLPGRVLADDGRTIAVSRR